MVSEL
ncbi:hypothetical protein F383_23717 [Gossypium arboreum]